jgi:hypothetical protein
MNLSELDLLLDQIPLVAHVHPVSLAFLEQPVKVYATARAMALSLDTNVSLPLERMLTFDADPHYLRRFPQVTCGHDPFTSELNRVLLARYGWIAEQMLYQPRIAERIVTESNNCDTIVLLLLDGLSYADCQQWSGVEPCLSVLPSITRVCFPAIVNDPPIAGRLFSKGFERRVGFTYWTRDDNRLTDYLFRAIGEVHQLHNGFGEVLNWMRTDTRLHKTYVQIVCSALDDYADGLRVAAPRTVIVEALWRNILAIAEALRERSLRARIYVTADHGLLWKDDEHPFETLAQERGSMRYSSIKLPHSRGQWGTLDNARCWILDYPQLCRAFHSNEQGTHGGISFEECVTPFVSLEV